MNQIGVPAARSSRAPPDGANYDLSQFPGYGNGCSTGTVSQTGGDIDSWNWRCEGVNGGSVSRWCEAGKNRDGQCASPPDGSNYQDGNFPGYKCDFGSVINTSEDDSGWSWTCTGVNEGSNSSRCEATKVADASCGRAHGEKKYARDPFNTEYSRLCTEGAQRNSGDTSLKWQWECQGRSGGASAACHGWKEPSVRLAGREAGTNDPYEDDSVSVPYNKRVEIQWDNEHVSSCTARGDWSGDKTPATEGTDTTSPLTDATRTYTYTLECDQQGSPFDAEDTLTADVSTDSGGCGETAEGDTAYGTAPTEDLCRIDSGSPPSPTAEGTKWQWNCTGQRGGETCDAPRLTCGSADGGTIENPPDDPTVQSCTNGPIVSGSVFKSGDTWTWDCQARNNPSDTVSCSADEFGPLDGLTCRVDGGGPLNEEGRAHVNRPVTWEAEVDEDQGRSYSYVWSGHPKVENRTDPTVSTRYNTTGERTAAVQVTETYVENGVQHRQTEVCQATLDVYVDPKFREE